MNEFSHFAVQDAVHATLTENAALMGDVTGVYDFVPTNTEYPYVVLGDARVTDISTVELSLSRTELEVHIYSRSRGRKETSDIMAQVHGVLHDSDPSMVGYSMVSLRCSGSDVSRERDGLTYHGRLRFVAVVQKN